MDCLEDEDRGGDAVDCCGSDMSWTGYIVRKEKELVVVLRSRVVVKLKL